MFDLQSRSDPSAVPGVVRRCHACGMWWKTGFDEATLAGAYGEDYSRGFVRDAATHREVTEAFFARVLDDLPRPVRGARPRLLDVGAGVGELVAVASAQGFDAEGIEWSADLAREARAAGRDVRQVRVEDLEDVERFDVVTMMDLLEHVPDPMGVLRRIHRALTPGGSLIVYTPNHAALVVLVARLLSHAGKDFAVREIFGRNHVAFFDDRTLGRALGDAGFVVESIVRSRYDPRRPGQPISTLELGAVTSLELLGTPFGRVFRLLAHARRR